MFKKNLIGVRPTEKTAVIMATPTNNTCRMNEAAAHLLGVSYNAVLNGDAFITAGIVDLAGTETLAFVSVSDPESTDCAKLASPTKKNYGSLQFASAGIHDALNGDNEQNVVWKFTSRVDIDDEGNATVLGEGETAEGVEGYTVEFYENRASGVGGKTKSADSGDSEPVAEADVVDEDDFI